MKKQEAKEALKSLLCRAYSGELAAALAYKGHAASVWNLTERAEIIKIYDEELHHRARLLQIIQGLGGRVDSWLEIKMNFIGNMISILCRIGRWIPCGWLISMAGAGRLESTNIAEYEHAARYAWLSGEKHLVDELLAFAETEWDHEKYFRGKTDSHFLSWIAPMWKRPPEKDSIRSSFEQFVAETETE